MKVDRGSRSSSGGRLWLSLIFSLEDAASWGTWTLGSVLQSSLPASILRAEDTTSEDLFLSEASLVVAAGFENITVAGFTSLMFVLTVCIKKVFWDVSFWRSVSSAAASHFFRWVLFVGVIRTDLTETETRGDDQKSAATISISATVKLVWSNELLYRHLLTFHYWLIN